MGDCRFCPHRNESLIPSVVPGFVAAAREDCGSPGIACIQDTVRSGDADLSRVARRLERSADAPNLRFKFREFLLNHRPHLVEIEAEVLMDQNVPKGHDLRPPDFWVLIAKALRHSPRGFADDLQMMDHPYLEHLVMVKHVQAD